MTPQVGEDFIQWRPPNGDTPVAEAEAWAAIIDGAAYAVDDETAFRVVDGDVEVISEGHWTRISD